MRISIPFVMTSALLVLPSVVAYPATTWHTDMESESNFHTGTISRRSPGPFTPPATPEHMSHMYKRGPRPVGPSGSINKPQRFPNDSDDESDAAMYGQRTAIKERPQRGPRQPTRQDSAWELHVATRTPDTQDEVSKMFSHA
ncbi:hypothetical protein K474DRAFT_1712670 [Panus rudis PR-1116 ss-1]|nr:hypothetical protein K474DRAFT_1712670 [Panus rudis PR-1116 ss-1]